MEIITLIFNAVGSAISGFATALASSVSSVTAMFYTPAGTGETSGSLTFLGVLLCVAMGVGLVYWAFRVIRSLIRNRG